MRVIICSMIGNALEWYDFALYGYFIGTIGSLFFPSTDPFISLIASFGVFAGGFVMRPLGAIIFGYIGDKIGRKKALIASIYLMAIPTTCIGLLPSYHTIGIWAPIILVLLRLLQGISMGGEFTGSMIFITEHFPNKGRGFVGSWAPFSLVVGIIVGSGIAALTSIVLPSEIVESWGWRIPFLFSIFGGFVGGVMRKKLSETPEYISIKNKKIEQEELHFCPIKGLFRNHIKEIFIVIFVDFVVAIGFFMIVTFITNYLTQVHSLEKHTALSINTLNMVLFALIIPFSGWLSDKIGRKKTLGFAAIGFILFSYPLFVLLGSEDFKTILLAQAALVVFMGFYFGPISAVLMEIFPTKVRFSGLSISHNISMAIFGGTAPLVCTYLVELTDNPSSPAFYLILASVLSLIGLYFMRDRYKEGLLK